MLTTLTPNLVQLAIIIHAIDAGYMRRINVIKNTVVGMLSVRIIVAKCMPIIVTAVPNHNQSHVFYSKCINGFYFHGIGAIHSINHSTYFS